MNRRGSVVYDVTTHSPIVSRLYYEKVAYSKWPFNRRIMAMNSPIRIPTTDSVGTARRRDYICFRFLRPAMVLKQKRVVSRATPRRKIENINQRKQLTRTAVCRELGRYVEKTTCCLYKIAVVN